MDTREDGSKILEGGQFVQKKVDGPVAESDGRMVPHITCFKYGRKGHYSDHCTEDSDNEKNKGNGANNQHMQQGDTVDNNEEVTE